MQNTVTKNRTRAEAMATLHYTTKLLQLAEKKTFLTFKI